MSAETITRAARVPASVRLMGLDVAAVSERETIEFVLEGLAGGRGGWICPVNLDVLRQWRASAEVRRLIAGADLVVADGTPLLWAGELQGSPLPGRVAGSALILSLTAAAAESGASIFLVGGNPGTAEVAAEKLANLSPGLRVAGTLCPPFGFETLPDWTERIEETLREAAPAIVYVGLGFPKQERLIHALRAHMPGTWFVSSGISFSFVAGEIERAPEFLQRLGLEWLHRMAHEPKRLVRRYLVDGIPFMVALICSAVAVRVGHAFRGAK